MSKKTIVTIGKIKFCKLLREGIITKDEITDSPLITLEEIKNSKKESIFELNVITFISESLAKFSNPDPNAYKPIPMQILPFPTLKNRIYFGHRGNLGNRRHFDIQYKPTDPNDVKDYMLVYFRVRYSINESISDDKIIVTENYIEPKENFPFHYDPETDRGTKTTSRIVRK